MRQFEHGGDIYRNKVKIDLSKNINPLGMPENVKAVLIEGINTFSDYPDPRCILLRERIAGREKVSVDKIVCGNGATELIYAICRVSKPKRGRIFPPTFSEYAAAMRISGCELTDDGADIVFICTPNNPTGKLTPVSDLKALARQCELLVIDECFIDFTDGESFVPELDKYPNVIVLKAFTKIYAMAGLRLGYIVSANLKLLADVREQIPCWSVSVPSQIAGVAALDNADWIERTREYVKQERAYLTSAMRGLVDVTESEANFIFFQTEKPIYEYMLARGILIRQWDSTHYRVAVSTHENNEAFVKWLRQL